MIDRIFLLAFFSLTLFSIIYFTSIEPIYYINLKDFLKLTPEYFLLFVFPVGGKIDMYLIQPWIDSTGHFFNRDNWYLERLNHEIV
ncbi:hypothetical protein ECE34_14590, partial [Acinetobacter baumannii]|nr:hypothetical protein [Acinetobacter baumannii]